LDDTEHIEAAEGTLYLILSQLLMLPHQDHVKSLYQLQPLLASHAFQDLSGLLLYPPQVSQSHGKLSGARFRVLDY